MSLNRAVVITVANQKGGVGKTTTTMNLGVALARAGKRVLLIDSDPQANLTSYLGVTPGEDAFTDLLTLDQVYLSKRPVDAEARKLYITSTGSGVDLIASDKALSGVEYYLFSRADRELVLSHFLNGVSPHYDFILIDTPPSLNLLTLNALCTSDHVLIPVQPEFFSLEGIVKIRESIENIRDRWNEKLTILGVLFTQVSQRRKLTQEVIDMLRTEMGELVLETMIHENAAVTESSGHARSVIEYDRASRGAKDYLAAAKEVLARLSERLSATKTDSQKDAIAASQASSKVSSSEANV
ncbi:MAG: ParA family protein [Bdellovibrionia bacterium]